MSAPWWDAPQLVLDFESTGTDLENDRAVQVAVVLLDSTGVRQTLCHVINPGIDIPQGAIDVHGITNERARAEGLDPAETITKVGGLVEWAWGQGHAVVACNATFDITLLDRELRRHAGRGLDLTGMAVLDPLVIDRAVDRYRKGSRKLDALAAHYRVRQEGAHDALADCLTAARVVWRQARHPQHGPTLRGMTLAEMQDWQARAHRAWADNYQSYLRTKASPHQPDAVVDASWPVRALTGSGAAA